MTTQLCGVIDPHSLDDYLAHDGYQAFRLALKQDPDTIIQAITDARLRGRGGAGFPTGQKWAISRNQPDTQRYIICNADEGDPGAFMDRTMIEGDPHRVLEGMLIAGRAIGAQHRLHLHPGRVSAGGRRAARGHRARRGIMASSARNILGSGMDFDFVVKEGAGAFVCGEETALMRSIEGYRGMPTMRPPYPSQAGLWGHPTNINNVESYASVPSILLNGPDWFAGLGTATLGRHQGIRSGRRDRELGAGRDPHRHDAARDDLRDRRRLSGRQGVQGRAIGRPVGRLHPRRRCWRHASTTRTSGRPAPSWDRAA